MRRPLLAVATSIVSIFVFLAIAEGVVRLFDPDLSVPGAAGFRFDQENAAGRPEHVRDDVLGWRLAPDRTEGIRTSARGFRGPLFSDEKPAGTFRIAFFGDSNPLGFGLDDEDAPYPRRVERILNEFYSAASGLRFESINLGVDGYSSHQTRILIDAMVERLSPDVVCIQAGFNDYCLASESDGEHDFSRPRLLDVLEGSRFYRWLRRIVLSLVPGRGELVDPVPRVAPEAFEENLTAMVRESAGTGARVVLLTTPARPTSPLVINEIPIQGKDRTVWMTQDRWLRLWLARNGVNPPDQPEHPDYVDIVKAALAMHPGWVILPYMLARAYTLQGRLEEAAEYKDRWRPLDAEREVLGRYAAVVHRVAEREGAIVVDVREQLEAYHAEAGYGRGDLYIDFVHLDEVGQTVIATAITRRIVEQVLPAFRRSR